MTAPTLPADGSISMRDLGSIPRAGLRLLDRSLAGRWWLLVATAMATVVSLFFAFPTYDNLDTHSKDWVAIQKIADHPFNQDGLTNTDRAYNFTFRVAVPLVGGRLGLGPQGYLVLQGLAGIGMFAAAAHIVNRLTGRRRLGALVAMTVGLMWAGACAFVELRGDFDAVAIALLAAAMATRRWYLVTLCCFAAAWTDERAIPAIAFVMLFHHVVESRELGPLKALRDPRVLGALGGLVLHFVTRIGASVAFDLHQGDLGVLLEHRADGINERQVTDGATEHHNAGPVEKDAVPFRHEAHGLCTVMRSGLHLYGVVNRHVALDRGRQRIVLGGGLPLDQYPEFIQRAARAGEPDIVISRCCHLSRS